MLTQKCDEFDREGIGQSCHGLQRRVPNTAFDLADEGAIHPGLQCQCFLRHAHNFASLAKIAGEDLLQCLCMYSHERTMRDYVIANPRDILYKLSLPPWHLAKAASITKQHVT